MFGGRLGNYQPGTKYPAIGVGVIILRQNKVLLGRRKGPRKGRDNGEYGLPGGLLEKNESFEMCAKREVFEETGLEDILVCPFTILRWNNDTNYFVDVIFYAESNVGNPIAREVDRVDTWEWFGLDNLPSPIYLPTKLALNRFISNRKFCKLSILLRKFIYPKKIILFEDSQYVPKE